MGPLSEWMQVMLGEIRRKREAFERDREEEALRKEEQRGQAVAPMNEPSDGRARGESDDDQPRVC